MILKNFTGSILTYFPSHGGQLVVIQQHGNLPQYWSELEKHDQLCKLGDHAGQSVTIPVKRVSVQPLDDAMPPLENVMYIVAPCVAALLLHRSDILTYQLKCSLSDSALQISHLYQPSAA